MNVSPIIIPTTRNEGKTLYDEETLKKNLKEIELFKLMSQSPNVVDFYGYGLYDNCLFICMELMDSSLSDVIRLMHIAKDFSNKFFAFTTVSIIEALIEFKKAGVTHGDIRPRNILIKRNGEIKLCLLGYSPNMYNVTYDSPEKFRGEEYDERADIWSLGITLLEFILGYHPLDHENPENTLNWIENFSWEEIEKKKEFHNHVKEDFYRDYFVKSFLKKCLEVDVQNRPNLMQIQELDLYKVFAPKSLDERRSEIASSMKKYEKFYEDLFSDSLMNRIQWADYGETHFVLVMKDCEFN
uniref:mitogen-activated protein kinase kinase n=1 Tax=Acrobeloides nanus TaxID=290746 RepID=A0A914CK18_9BILA